MRIRRGVLLVRVEHLADYNRSHGYQEGDQLLRAVADLLREESAGLAGITLAHLFGGDFALLCEGASHAQLAELAQRLAGALAALYGEMDLPSPDVGHVGVPRTANRRPVN